jgi:Lrp/AsnC family leucine-responsive transcriptional regulator
MDSIDLKIIDILQTDGRITMKELGQRVGLTSPATIERVKKLEDIAKAGLPVRAFILVTTSGQAGTAFVDFARRHPSLLDCHRLAGSASYLVAAAVTDTAALETLLDELTPFGSASTHLVLSTPVAGKKINLS